MALFGFGKKKIVSVVPTVENNRFVMFTPQDIKEKILSEQFKGQVPIQKVQFPRELGEEHPFNFAEPEGLYKNFGMLKGAINRMVDFVVGGGFFVTSNDPRAEKIISDFLRDTNFATILRSWLKEALIKGTGFLEIGGKADEPPQGMKVLDAKFMWVMRSDKGVVEGYNQWIADISRFSKNSKPTKFEPDQVSVIGIDRVGSDFYGQGLVNPNASTIDALLANQHRLSEILRRKAENPTFYKINPKDGQPQPTQSEIDSIGNALEANMGHENWVLGPGIEPESIDRGNPSDKFSFVIEHHVDAFIFGIEVPMVVMGQGSIPEGLAKAQLEVLDRKAQSIRDEMEMVIEQDIFKRVLLSQGMEARVDFHWGQPSRSEVNEKLDRVQRFLSLPNTCPAFVRLMESQAIDLLDLNVDEFEKERQEDDVVEQERERDREEEEPQPGVPGQNEIVTLHDVVKYSDGWFDHPHSHVESEDDEDVGIEEWLGFNFREYMTQILEAVQSDDFSALAAKNDADLKLGKLTTDQIESLRDVLDVGFREGKSIRDMAREITEEVSPKDLFRVKDGKRVLANSARFRAINIARTETTRLANEGALRHFDDGGIKRVRFVATFSARTCPICEGLNDTIFEAVSAVGVIPVHNMCRCTWVPVVEE